MWRIVLVVFVGVRFLVYVVWLFDLGGGSWVDWYGSGGVVVMMLEDFFV